MSINISNVAFHYPGRASKPVLQIPKWEVKSGELVLIYGPSGSGKTTFLNTIAGLILPVQGSIEILGEKAFKMPGFRRDAFRAKNIGYVFQQFNLIPYLNVIDNIKLAANFSKKKEIVKIDEEIIVLLKALNIAEEDWELHSRRLSHGQAQRVAIARVLINRPKIIIADEPTSSLDPLNKGSFINLLLSFVAKYEITLIVVSHDRSLSKYFNRVELFSEINII